MNNVLYFSQNHSVWSITAVYIHFKFNIAESIKYIPISYNGQKPMHSKNVHVKDLQYYLMVR